MISSPNSLDTVKLLKEACNETLNIFIESEEKAGGKSKIQILANSFFHKKSEEFFVTLLASILEKRLWDDGHRVFLEASYRKDSKIFTGTAKSNQDLLALNAGDLFIRKSMGTGFDKDALMYVEAKNWGYGDFDEFGKLCGKKNAMDLLKDVFCKLGAYKKQHPDTPCYMLILGYGASVNTPSRDKYSKPMDLDKRRNFLKFIESGAEGYGLKKVLELPLVSPGQVFEGRNLGLDVAVFEVQFLDESKRQELIRALYPNEYESFNTQLKDKCKKHIEGVEAIYSLLTI